MTQHENSLSGLSTPMKYPEFKFMILCVSALFCSAKIYAHIHTFSDQLVGIWLRAQPQPHMKIPIQKGSSVSNDHSFRFI